MVLQGPSGDAHPWVATQEDPALIEPVARAAAGMVGLLAEAVRPLGDDIELSTAVETWSCGQHELDLAANGWTGYWPTVEAIGQGGYEVDAAKAMGRDTADTQELIDRLAALAERVG